MQATAPAPFLNRNPNYSVSVSEVMRLALPPGTTVLAGQHGLGRSIFWARLLGARQGLLGASESGEMVLLPASAVGKSFARVLRDLGDAGVEAVLVVTEPPPDALAVADELDIPILRLATPGSLVDTERAIVSLIVDRESQLRRRVEQIYERLLTTLVDDAGIAALAAEVATSPAGRPSSSTSTSGSRSPCQRTAPPMTSGGVSA